MNAATAVALVLAAGACSSSAVRSESPTPTTGNVTTTASTTSTPSTTSTAAPAGEMRWQLDDDFRRHPSDNPFPRAAGGPAVWSLRQGTSLDRGGPYPRLREYARALRPGLAAWHGRNASCGGLPAIGVTASRAALVCGATVPANAVFVSPAPDAPAVVEWQSPIAGEVLIAAGFADLDARCGGNVRYRIDRGPTLLALGEVVPNGSKTLPPLRTPIARGQSIDFVVGPNADTKPGCDATQLQVTIAPAS